MTSDNLAQHFAADCTVENSKNSESLLVARCKVTLSEAAAEIASLARRADGYTVALAIKIAQLKHRLIAKEENIAVNWATWIAKETKISKSYVYVLAKIGLAEDPAKALKKAQRIWAEKQMKKDLRVDALSENHKMMIHLVHKLSNDEAKREYTELWKRYRSRVD